MVASTKSGIDQYDLDPDVAVITRKSALSAIPVKSPMSGRNPQLQPEAEYSYETDPDIAVITKKPKTERKEEGFHLPSWLNTGIQTAAGVVSGLVNPIAGGVYGLAKSIPEAIKTGQAPQPIAQKYAEQFMQAGYRPTDPQAQANLQALNEIFEASKLPPVFPEALGLGVESRPAAVAGKTAQDMLRAQFANRQLPKVRIEPTGMQSGGAAAAGAAQAVGDIDAALANASPELTQHIKSMPTEKVNLPALETRRLEEKHGIDLTEGQRVGDTSLYSQEWNKRGETETLGQHFNNQPQQFVNAFEQAKIRHAPDIPAGADASELGQHEINALAAKDKIRTDAISKAYKALEDANGGQFPIDISTLKDNIKGSLAKALKTSRVTPEMQSDLNDFYKNPTFESYEALRTNLANDMRTGPLNNRGAAYIIRQELENLPVFGEEGGSPQAIQLKALADNARSLYKERQNVLKNNPAYRKAVGEAADLAEAESQGESLNAAKFHQKFVSSATPEAIRRMKAEIAADDIAHQAITYGELDRAQKAAVPGNNLTPDAFARFMRNNKSGLRESLPPEAMQDVSEIGTLASKVGMPKSGTFNYSNTWSSMLKDFAQEGLLSGAESALAAKTMGASVPMTQVGRSWLQNRNKESFAKRATDPFSGLTKE